jgi:carboxylate-amine ligase
MNGLMREVASRDSIACPRADIAGAAAVTAAVRSLVEETWCSTQAQQAWDERELGGLFREGIRDADETVIDHRGFLKSFGYPEPGRARVKELWQHLIETLLAKGDGYDEWRGPLEHILGHGCLARRIIEATGQRPSDDELRAVYARLASCLGSGELFST